MSADPRDPHYLDEADVRAELTRVFDRCHGCQQCTDLCPTFPLLFERIARRAGDHEPEAGRLTPADQDEIVDSCLLCNRCVGVCPPAIGENHDVHVPHTVLRARAMLHGSAHTSLRTRRTDALVARPDRLARVARAIPLGRRMAAARPGGVTRRVVGALTGVSAVRLLPPYARQRFSTWFRERGAPTETSQRVTLVPTCLVEYHAPEIGRDLVAVYEHNGIGCDLSDVGCCGAAALHAGHHEQFRTLATRNIEILAVDAARGDPIVVPQPTCRSVIVEHYPRVVDHPDVGRIVARVVGAAAPLLARLADGSDTCAAPMPSATPARIAMHVPCHARAQPDGDGGVDDGLDDGPDGGATAMRRLLELTGAEVTPIAVCSGSGGAWGIRSGHEDLALPMARTLGAAITETGCEVVVGECHSANTAIVEQTGRTVMHPIQVVARAYGIGAD